MGRVVDLVHCLPESFEAGRIGPMRVLKDHQHRTFACKGLDLREERLQRFLPALLRR
jgi:hypothetical protein